MRKLAPLCIALGLCALGAPAYAKHLPKAKSSLEDASRTHTRALACGPSRVNSHGWGQARYAIAPRGQSMPHLAPR